MAKNIIKAGVSDKYFVEAAAIFCNENERTPEIKSERKYCFYCIDYMRLCIFVCFCIAIF